MKKHLLLFTFILSFGIQSQVLINNFPENLKLYKRDVATNTAIINSSGTVEESTNYTNLVLEVFKNNILQQSTPYTLSYVGGVAHFNFNSTINAELATYKFRLISNTGVLLREASDVLAGDLYIFNGQSNMEWHKYYPNSFPLSNPFIRTIDTNGLWIENYTDVSNYGGISYWLATNIINNEKIPVAFINQGKSGRKIGYFQRKESNKYDINTNYGKLLQRFTNTGFNIGDVKAYVWYQGETDATITTTYDSYLSLFNNLYLDVKEDFNPEKFYVFQIHSGCGIRFASEITEAQRQLKNIYPSNLELISTNGALQGADNCHYFGTNGFQVLADRLYNIIAFDFYNSGDNSGIYSPDIENISFTDVTKSKIKFKLTPETDSFTWENGVENDFFIENSASTITNGSINGNEVTLNLSTPATETNVKLTYLGRLQAESPYIKNQNGIGLLNFKNLSINDYINTNFTTVLDGSWSYYYNNTDLVNPILAIEHTPIEAGANTTTFSVDAVGVTDNGNVISSTNTVTKRGTFNLAKYWNLYTNTLPNGWINVRFFYPASLETNLVNNASTFATTNSAGFTSSLIFIKTNQTFNPTAQINSEGYSIGVKKVGETTSYGTYAGNNYVQLNKVVLENNYTGGSVIKKVDNVYLHPAGTIRYNSIIQKFQGFNGTQWVNFN